jgi:putative Mg2+ transporter-C (MgtC) family protein
MPACAFVELDLRRMASLNTPRAAARLADQITPGLEHHPMPVTLEWHDLATRLVLTILAGALIGINRTERGRAVGLRTTILVCLAASVSMIQANLLMSTTGKTPDSFVTLDLMRLPLGILTGMGFIGGGAILRRGELVRGVTTAATLWLVTVIGLCLGGGQIGLGLATLALALIVLWALKWLEQWIHKDRRATLTLSMAAGSPTEEELRAMLLTTGHRLDSWDVTYKEREGARHWILRCEMHWRGQPDDLRMPAVLEQLKQQPGVLSLRWSA